MSDQFSVHRNPGRNKRAVPFVVVVQSNRCKYPPAKPGALGLWPLKAAGLGR
jgi:hypothetical protein